MTRSGTIDGIDAWSDADGWRALLERERHRGCPVFCV